VRTESWKRLIPKIPLLKDNFAELRQWTMRFKQPELRSTGLRPLPIPEILTARHEVPKAIQIENGNSMRQSQSN
jgi:hypothetical protein